MKLSELKQRIRLTMEICGTQLSEEAVNAFAVKLAPYGERAILRALDKCEKELTGRVSLAAIIDRIQQDDGRPGVEEAWSTVAQILADESQSAMLTDEMQTAYYAASPVYNDGDKVAARMTFKEVYQRHLDEARAAGLPAKWNFSQGTDKTLAAAVVRLAYERGQITQQAAQIYLPATAHEERYYVETNRPLSIEDKRNAQAQVARLLENLSAKGKA